jgi:hypothetical protein
MKIVRKSAGIYWPGTGPVLFLGYLVYPIGSGGANGGIKQ